MPSAPYAKPPLTLDQQIRQLLARGMSCADEALAKHYLGYINDYRLAAQQSFWKQTTDATP